MRKSVLDGQVKWQAHALSRMLERGIARAEVLKALVKGEVIETYPEDKPFPRMLVLGRDAEKILHVVCAHDPDSGTGYVITVYRPDLDHFDEDYKTRRTRP